MLNAATINQPASLLIFNSRDAGTHYFKTYREVNHVMQVIEEIMACSHSWRIHNQKLRFKYNEDFDSECFVVADEYKDSYVNRFTFDEEKKMTKLALTHPWQLDYRIMYK